MKLRPTLQSVDRHLCRHPRHRPPHRVRMPQLSREVEARRARWPRLTLVATQLGSALERRPLGVILIMFVALIAGCASGQVGASLSKEPNGATTGSQIYASLFIIQAIFAFLSLAYSVLVWARNTRSDPEQSRRSLIGVVKWEVGWAFLIAVATLTQFMARSAAFSWASLDSTFLSLIAIGLVVSGSGDIYANWPSRRRGPQVARARSDNGPRVDGSGSRAH